MKKSKISILLLFLVMILAISAVSAADTNDTSDSAVQAVDEAPVDEVASVDVGAVAATDDAAVLADPGDKNFTQLQAEIDQSTTGVFTLDSNYVRQDGESDIEINKNFNIFGNDVYTIDANNKGGIFKINQGSSVLLNNVILINGNGINGGAIYNEGTVNIMSSTLTGNDASNGGAIYSTGIATISGSTINENTATNGGAIYSTGTLVVSDGNTFNDNVAANRGGAIYSTNVEISNSNFNDNTAGEGAGVYVANGAKLTAEGTTFKHNVASEYDGGAIYTVGGEIDLDGCILDSNDVTKMEASASENKGGTAIYAKDATVSLTNTDVINNGRDFNRTNGDLVNGALNLLNSDTTIASCLFGNNTGIYGGAIYAEDGKIRVSKSNFVANNAYSGGAIQLEGNMDFSIEDSTFTDNNKAVGIGSPGYTAGGGAIFVRGAGGSIDNITVEDSYSSQGGAVDIESTKATTITGSTFENNHADNRAGALYLYAPSIIVDNCTFENNDAGTQGGAIFIYDNRGGDAPTINNVVFKSNSATNAGAIWAFDNVDISGCEFTDNTATENGGAIYFTKYCTESSVTDSKFTGNTAASGNAMYNNKGTLAFSNNTIDAGANIVNNGTITSSVVAVVTADKAVYRIEEVTLTATLTDDNGNAINDTAFKFVFNTPAGLAAIPATFNGNNYIAKFTPAKDGEYNVTVNYAGDVTNATFTVYRTLTDLADKIAAANGNPVVLDGDYTYNVAYDSAIATAGGIAIASGITIDGKGYTICGNDATRIFNVASGVTLTLNNVTVCHGNASDGAGVYIASGAGLVANDVTFEHNTAVSDGGAIYATGATVELTRCILDANDVTEIKTNDDTGGAAIFANNSALTIRNSKITNNGNKSLNRSNDDLVNGVLNLFNSKTVITDSLFENNTGIYGGAIIAQSLPKDISLSSLTVSGTNFTRNTAYNGGGIYTSYTTLNISDCLFTDNNKATGIGSPGYTSAGGAINVMTGSVATISNITVRGSYSATGAAISTQKSNVVIEKSTFEDNYAFSVSTATGVGGAIFLDGPSIVDNCTFKNNYAETNGGAIRVNDVRGESIIIKNVICDSNGAGNGGAIYLTDFNITVTDSEFINNDATENGGAIAFSNWCTYGCSVNNSNFTGNTAGGEGNAIYGTSASKFSLSNNIVSGSQADIVSAGEIESQINVTTYNAIVHYGGKVNLTATITDDNGNLIDASDFYFVVNNTNYGPAVYNPATGKYEFEQEFNLTLGTYEITMKYDKELTYVEKGNLTAVPKKGTYSDLQAQIDALAPGETLELTYDFAYDAGYDADRFPNGVIINKALAIIGNDHFISGADTVRIFRIGTFANADIKGVVFKNGKTDKGGALFVAGKLSIDNCTFVNNTATVSGHDIHIMTTSVVVVNGEESYNYLLNDPDSSLNKYYADNPREDGIDADGNPVHDLTTQIVGHSWESAITTWMDPITINGTTYTWQDGYSKFPWILINLDDYTGPIVFKYDGETKFVWNVANKQRGVISILEDLKMPDYTLTYQYGTVRDKVFDPSLLTVEYNGTSSGKAVVMLSAPGDAVIIKNSVFDSDEYSIYNLGTLSLENNTVKGGIYNNGTIVSDVNATVLDNKTVNVTTSTYELNATLTDDNGNKIYDPELRFTVNGEKIADKPAYSNGLYTVTSDKFTTDNPSYLIDLAADNEASLATETGVIVNILRGTFTDLQQRIEAANGDLVLPYDFTYDAEIDGDNFVDGIALTKNIVGNGSVIDANGANVNIFVINAGSDVKISNVTITGVNRASNKNYGAVVNHGSLTVEDVVFVDNKINRKAGNNAGVAIFNDGTALTVVNSQFINNTSPHNFEATSGKTIEDSVGAIHSTATSGVYIKDSYFEANIGRWGAAITFENLNQATVAVENCTFFNNTAYQGGAININGGARYVNITNCNFDSNSFRGPAGIPQTGANGAAISVGFNVPVTLEIKDSIFKNNMGDDINPCAGVAIRLSDYATGIITNCTFENNGKGHGSAINVGTYYGSSGGLTLKNSTFINSIADENIMVFINPGINAEIENCTFENSGANYTIESWGTLTLNKNTINAALAIKNVNGTINSEVKAVLIDGKNVTAALGEIVIANATLTDDNGNAIYDSEFNITVAGVELETFYDAVYKLYTASYTIETAGNKTVSTNYAANITKGKYVVDKANVTSFIVEVRDIVENESAIVNVTLIGVNDEGLTRNVTVIVKDTPYTIKVINGTGIETIAGLAHGQYPVTAMFVDDSNYNDAFNSTAFYVKTTTKIIIDPVGTVKYGTNVTLVIHLSDGNGVELSGSVVIAYDEFTEVILVTGGDATFDVTSRIELVLGDNNVTVFFAGDNEYNASENSTTINVIVNVIDPDDVIVDMPSGKEFGQDIPINITSPVDGNYTVNINGTVVTVEVINHTGSAIIPALPTPGNYNGTVTIVDGNYSLNKAIDEFDYFKAPEYTVNIEGTYPNATITITGTPGDYHVIIDGLDEINMTIAAGNTSANYTIDKINAGNYSAYVSFDAYGDFHGDVKEANFTINKAEIIIVPQVIGETVVDSPLNITFTLPTDITGDVFAFMDGVPVIDLTNVSGVYTLKLDGFPIQGDHLFSVEVRDDPNYNDTYNQVGFIIEKVTPVITITDIAGNVGDTVEANVTIAGGDATGYILYDGAFYVVKDGQATIQVKILTAGMQGISVNYTGDDKYFNGTANKGFNAGKGIINNISTDIDNGTEYVAGNDLTVVVTVDPAVSGNYTLWINGVEQTGYGNFTVVDGEGSFIILAKDLPAGDYNITVQFKEDDFYKASENATYLFTVVKTPTTIGANITNGTEFVAGDDLTVEVTVIPAVSGTYTLWIDGELASDYGTLNVYNGEGSFIILAKDLPAGEHNITLRFDEDDLYYASENATYAFSVVKTNTTIEANITNGDEFVAGNDLTVEVTVDPKVTGTYSLWIDGVEATGYGVLNVYNGEGSFIILAEDLKAGEHNITIKFDEDDLFYASENVTYVFTVVKTNTTIETDVVNGTTWTAGNDLTVEVTVDPKVTGTYSLWIDGVEATGYGVLNVYNGEGSFIILAEDLKAGEHNITVQFDEDDLFYASENVTYVFTVVKTNTTIETDVLNGTNVTAGDDLAVVVTVDPAVSGTYTLWVNGELASDYGVLTVYNGKGSFIILAEDLPAGDYNITVQFNEDDLYYASENVTYVFSVVKTPTVISTSIENDTEFDVGDDLYVVVTVDPKVNGIYTLWIDGELATEYGTLTVYNGEGSFIILADDLDVGSHNITVQFNENDLYLASENATSVFKVISYTHISTDIVNESSVDACENLTVEITVDPAVNGTYTLWIDGIEATEYGPLTIEDGEGLLIIDAEDLLAGPHSITVQFVGDEFYKPSEEVTYIVIATKKDSIITITTGDVVIDEPLEVNITIGNLTGNVTVAGNVYQGIVTLTNGEGTFTIARENMTYGSKSIVVMVNDNDKYANNISSCNFNVEKAENYTFELNITVPDINIRENLTFNVTLPEDANGKLTVKVDGKSTGLYVDVVNGNATVFVPAEAFTAGRNNTIEVTFTPAGDKYNQTTATKEIYVNKLDYNLTATAEDIELDQNATIVVKLPEGADGNVFAELQGNIYSADADGIITIENLTVGTYTAYVLFIGDSIYKDNQTKVTFNVTKVVIPADKAFNVTTPENATAPEFTINLPEDATGYLLLDVNGTQTHVPLVNGTATAKVPSGMAPGNYSAVVTYTGDNKYDPITTTQNITVTSNVPDNAFTIPDTAKDGEPLTYSISLPSDAKGFLEVVVDGKRYVAELQNGAASITVPGLSAGSHNVTVSYTGDGKYSPVSKSMTINVPTPVYKVSNNKNVVALYSAKAYYKVLITKDGKPVGAGEKVTIKYNGKTYIVKTNANGIATLKLNTNVKVKKYTITAEYKGVKVSNKVKIKNIIKAKNKKVKKFKKVTKVKISLKKVNKKYLKNKVIKVKFRGKIYKIVTNKKGVATWKVKKSMLRGLKVGKKYKYKVTYGKDVVTKKLTIRR